MSKFSKAGFKTESQERSVAKYRTTFNFRIAQRCDQPEVNNLWDLMAVDSEGQVLELIVDADTLDNCINRMSDTMEAAGF